MQRTSDAIVQIQAEWNGWRSAEARLDDLEELHWRQPSGAPHPLIHAFVRCTRIAGELPHDRERTACPHRVLVCVVKRHVLPSVYAELTIRARGAAFQGCLPVVIGRPEGLRYEGGEPFRNRL